MTFPGDGVPFGASGLIIPALIVVILIIGFAVVFGAYLIFADSKEQRHPDEDGAPQLTGRRVDE